MIEPIVDTAAHLFYNRLFEIDPSARPLFANTDMNKQRDKFLDTLELVVKHVGQLDEITPKLEELGRSHVRYGVEDHHYDSVASALLWALQQGLGDVFTDDVRDAWIYTYTRIAAPMRKAGKLALAENA